MLQHESQEQAAATPAAQIRVTSEELAQAINALEAREDEAARHLAGTVPIGEVVAELKLEATPEEVWAQVQRQRAQAAQEEAARVRQAAVPVVPVTRDVQRRARGWRRLGRGWSRIKGWLWILFWCGGGMGLVSSVLHPSHTTASVIMVNGDHRTQTYNATGKDVEINANDCTIYVHGKPLSVTVNGSNDRVVTDTARDVEVNGSDNTVNWIGAPTSGFSDNGHNNTIGPQRR